MYFLLPAQNRIDMLKNITYSLIIFASLYLVTVVLPRSVYAGCTTNYGGYGETCIYNKSFEIDKDVRVEDEDDDWEDKVTDVAEDDVVEFRIKVENVGEVTVDNMKMEDFLPDEMERVGGSGLTEYWDDFEPGDKKEFTIKAKVKEDEYDRENFEKCIVNKAEIEYDGDFEGSDTATVCYGNAEITELPDTGPTTGVALSIGGLVMMFAGILVKKQTLA